MAMDIKGAVNGHLSKSFSNQINVSTSPEMSFQSPSFNHGPSFGSTARRNTNSSTPRPLKPFVTKDIKILLLENVNDAGQNILRQQGYQVEALKAALPEAELIEKIRDVHVLGIRSKTKLTAKVLREARELLVVGCFCIGTNQVDLKYAAEHGIAVFNSPFSNSRSVAELIIGEIIALARQLADRSMELHQGCWNKVSNGCWEVRGKTLGIVGYGHIGNQLSVLAEAMGMKVIFFDVMNLMSMGTARQTHSLDELLGEADFVTLHVPELPETKNMIGEKQFDAMKNGSYLINASRGSVVDIQALVNASRAGKIAGAALDVFPHEPGANGDYFNDQLNTWCSGLQGLKNIILTPHIGGSTEEAQRAIGFEVAEALVHYVNEGVTLGAVNVPEVNLRSISTEEMNHARVRKLLLATEHEYALTICAGYLHSSECAWRTPKRYLSDSIIQKYPLTYTSCRLVNEVLGDHNVEKQMTDSRGDVAYLMADISDVNVNEIRDIYSALEGLSCVPVSACYLECEG